MKLTRNIKRTALALICLQTVLFLSTSLLVAERPSSATTSKPRKLSHLDFDKDMRPKKTTTTTSTIPVIKEPVFDPNNIPPPPLEVYKEDLNELNAYKILIPKLQGGPNTDKDNPSAITSSSIWTRGGGLACKYPGNEFTYCQKALALKDIFNRLTGNNEFAESHCTRPCSTPGTKAMIHTITLEAPRGEDLLVVDKTNECRYKLTKRPAAKWMVINALEIECACVPMACGDTIR